MHQPQPDIPVSPQFTCDCETFRRVWRRVMPEDRPDCPFTLIEPEQPPAPAEPRRPPACPQGMEPPPGGGTMAEPEPLPEEAPRCLSITSAPYLPQLQELTLQAAGQWRFYQQLARRTAGPFARTLSGLAADQRRHAKRLSAAAFLISGVRLFPAEGRGAALPAPLPAALRAAFAWEQQTESVLRAAAVETADEALQSLYLELAEEDAAHADAVRGLLEQL